MDDKKYLPFKIIHLILMFIVAVMTFIDLIKMTRQLGSTIDLNLLIDMAFGIVNIMAMDVGILYLVSGYKKNSAMYYKLFFGLLSVALVIRIVLFLMNKANTLLLVCSIVSLILSLVLFLKKDLGRNYSLILFITLFLIEIVIKFPFMTNDASIRRMGNELSMFMLFGTAGFMISAKYIDKELRGTK